jgi:hypothetical protein
MCLGTRGMVQNETELDYAMNTLKASATDPDPTLNVKESLAVAVARLDDLRVADAKRFESELSSHVILGRERVEHLQRMAELRAEYTERLTIAEAKRIDAIRAVDVNAVAVASQRSSDQASVLAAQVAQSADALRTLVASTATTVANAQQQLATTLNDRLTKLEQSQYIGQGRAGFTDPALAELLVEMKGLRESRASGAGVTRGANASWVVLTGGIGLLATLLSMGALIYTLTKPAVIEVPVAPLNPHTVQPK